LVKKQINSGDMNTKLTKYSRRKFLYGSIFSVATPFVLPSFLTLLTKDQKNNIADLSDRDKITDLLKRKDPLKWIFTGDSITAGVKHTHGYRSYPEVFSERLRYEMKRSRDHIINTGISGNTTRNIVEDFDWRIKQYNPSVVSLMFGTNDCADGRNISLQLFKTNLDYLVSGIRALGAIPILHTPNLIIKDKAPERSSLHKYVEVIKSVAEEQKLILVDNWEYWNQAIVKTSQAKVFKEWLNDPLHPSGEGHSEIARLMFRELGIFNANDPSGGGPYYEGEH
jgi:acyl-CoA thioesterase-1